MEDSKREGPGISPDECRGWDGFIRKEIERFLGCYQALEIEVRAQDTEKTSLVHVHVPYMLGTVTWVDQPEILSRQRPRHQARLKRVHQARQAAAPEIRAFFHHWFYKPDGTERLVAIGRSGPEDIRQLLLARNRRLAAFHQKHKAPAAPRSTYGSTTPMIASP